MKWYQLHLSTLLAVMLLASVLVWLNVRHQPCGLPDTVFITKFTPEEPQYQGRGWPQLYQWQYDEPGHHQQGWDWTALQLDGFICVLLLALAGAVIEWRTRRVRSRRAGA